MHDDRACYGSALRVAVQWTARNPQLLTVLRKGGPEAARLRQKISRSPGARCYLSHARSRPGAEQPDPLLALAEEAETWLVLDQFTPIAHLWDQWSKDGTLDGLGRVDRAVLHGLLMLAMRSGPQVIAATRYVRVLIRHEFGVAVSHTAVGNAYRRLHDRNLLEVLPGRSAQARDASTLIEFGSVLGASYGSPSDQAMAELTMSPGTIEALA